VLVLLLLILFSFRPVFAESSIEINDFSSDSSTEWIQLKNTNSNSINLNGWYFKDLANTIKTINNICISGNSTQIFEFNSYLNNDGDTVNLYDSNGLLIDQLIYSDSESKNQISPGSTNTCLIPTNTPTPTNSPTPTLTPSPTPTVDPTIVNPTSGIKLTEFMPYSNIEWIELYNSNDYDVKLVAWKIEDNNAHTKNISELLIKSKNYAVFEFSSFLNNSESDKLILYDQNQKIIDSYQYPSGKFDLEKAWSKNDNIWCLTTLSKGQSNYQCLSNTPTSTPTPTATVTPELTPSIEPTPIITDFPSSTQKIENSTESSNPGSVLGESSETVKRNFLPVILIFSGAILLLSPLIISKLKRS